MAGRAGELSRVEGLLLGSLIGDAAGGPVEFAPTNWREDELLSASWSEDVAEKIGARFRLRDYPMKAAPYAQWIDFAPAGTITDDSRHKLILLESLEETGAFSRESYLDTAIAYYADDVRPDVELRRSWLEEYCARFRWMSKAEFGKAIGEGNAAYPAERVWGGVPTMAGQMPLLQVAGAYAGKPREAYLKSWEINILDTAYGMDITSGLVAGLSQALVLEGDWGSVIEAMIKTDPYDFAKVPWVDRRLERWLGRAEKLGAGQYESTAAFFSELERKIEAETWWEAHVPLVITFAIFEYTSYDPLSSMELALAFGHDTDSTAQLMGAFLGAMHGRGLFDAALAGPVEEQLKGQYGVSVDDWAKTLVGNRETVERIAFGSCLKGGLPQPIWAAVAAQQPQVWIWMGDTIYGDSEDMAVMAAKYGRLKENPGYAALRKSAAVIGTWDDHDYGVNNGGKEFPAKVGSQKALLDFLDVPESSERRQQEGVYWVHNYGVEEKRVKVILLDVRYHRDWPGGANADMLGTAQWKWLEETLGAGDAALTLIVSGVQVLQVDHRYEKWDNFPASRTRLLDLAASVPGRVVFLSGDRHISEIARLEHGPAKKELVEVTSSSLTHSWEGFPGEPNRYRVGEVYPKNNFGLVEIDWEASRAAFQVRSETGEVALELDLSL